jgi:hypothetical protein
MNPPHTPPSTIIIIIQPPMLISYTFFLCANAFCPPAVED